MPLRLKVVFRLLISWGLPLLVVVLLGGSGGMWWASLMGKVSFPFLALAVCVGAAFPTRILKRPTVWAGFAVAISLAGAFVVAGSVGLVFGAMIAVPAAALFVFSVRKLPLSGPAAT